MPGMIARWAGFVEGLEAEAVWDNTRTRQLSLNGYRRHQFYYVTVLKRCLTPTGLT
jgi:hypothetical protein